MKNLVPPNDTSPLTRIFFIPYLIKMFKIARTPPDKAPQFPYPRFELFVPVNTHHQVAKKGLLYTLAKAYTREIALILVVSVIWTVLNLMVPQIVKQFYALMKMTSLEGDSLNQANYITQIFIVLQILRTMAGATTLRLSHQLSNKVQASIAAELVNKALRLNQQVRRKLPQSQVYQLDITDRAMVGKLFQTISSAAQIPLTLIVAICLLFMQSAIYGIFGLFWIVIAFFLQSYFCQRLSQNSRLRMSGMQERARFNYELMERMREARLDGSQGMLVQRNNDFYGNEMHYLHQFHQYKAMLKITLTLLPMIILFSIVFYDSTSQNQHFKCQDVYNLLALLIIAFKPLSNIHSVVVSVQEGLFSLKRIQMYLNLKENLWMVAQGLRDKRPPQLVIQENTKSSLVEKKDNKKIRVGGFTCKDRIGLQGGERLTVLGNSTLDTTIFLMTALRQIKWEEGDITLDGSLAVLPEENFFLADTVMENIKFYDQKISEQKVRQVCDQLGLLRDLEMKKGLNEVVTQGKFTFRQLKKIGLARVLCSDKKVYLLDCPFMGLGADACNKLQVLLRKKQSQGVMIILTSKILKNGQPNDKIMILQQGQSRQFGKLGQLLANQYSFVHKYNISTKISLTDCIKQLPILKRFQEKIRKMMLMTKLSQTQKTKQGRKELKVLLQKSAKYCRHLYKQSKKTTSSKIQSLSSKHYKYFQVMLRMLPLAQWLFVMLVIVAAELLGLFNQLQVGKETKRQGDVAITQLGSLLHYQLAFSVGIALMIYLENAVNSAITDIICNKIYDRALTSASKKPIQWYSQGDAPLIAHKFNHDYGQIDQAVHQILLIFRCLIIMTTTIYLIDAPLFTIVALTLLITLIYTLLLILFKKVQEKLIQSYQVYKKQFVPIFDQIIQGALMINVFCRTKQLLLMAKNGFINVATYKMFVSNSKIIEGILCDLANTIIIAIAIEYGTIRAIQGGQQNQALVAVSVMLLFNLSDVLKKMVLGILKLQSQFRLKIFSYMQIIDLNPPAPLDQKAIPKGYQISFSKTLLQQKQDPVFEAYPFTLTVPQNQNIIIFEPNTPLRTNILLALTQNIAKLQTLSTKHAVSVGRRSISQIPKDDLRYLVGVILPHNFYFPGTLRQNLQWNNRLYDEQQAVKYSRLLDMSKEIPHFQDQGLDVQVPLGEQKHQMTRKIALLKVMLRKPRVLILKDTPWMIGGKSVVDILNQQGIQCTIVGITSDLVGCKGANRIMLTENLQIKQDLKIQEAMKDPLSESGELLRNANLQTQGMWRPENQVDLSKLLRPSSTRDIFKAMVDVSKKGGHLPSHN